MNKYVFRVDIDKYVNKSYAIFNELKCVIL